MLTDDKRTQLDGIVQKMTSEGQSHANIQFVVNDFKTKYDSPAPQTTQTQGGGGFFSTLGDTIKNSVTSQIDFAKGLGKSVANTVVGGVNLANKVGNKFEQVAQDVTGLPLAQHQAPMLPQMKANNTNQQVGETTGDIAQFFIPGGAEAKAGEAINMGVDAAKFAEKFGPKAGEALSGILKTLGQGAITGASTAGVTALETGGNKESVKAAGSLGFFAGAGGKALELVSPGISKALEKANFRLSPAKEAKLGQRVDEAATFMAKDRYIGTANMKFNKLSKQTSSFENAIQSSIPKGETVPKQEVIDKLNAIVDTFKDDPAKYTKVKNDVGHAVEVLNETNPGNSVSLDTLLNSKRSYGGAAFSKDGSAMINDSKYAIENAFYDTLSSKLENTAGGNIQVPKDLQKFFDGKTEVPLKDFNKVYGNAINSRKWMNLARNKSDTSFVTRALATWFGATVGGPLGAVAGEVGASSGGTLARSLIGAGTQTAASTVPTVAKTALGATFAGGTAASPTEQ